MDRHNFEVNIKTLKENFPESCQLGIGEDFCIFDVGYDAGRNEFGYPCKLDGNVILFCIDGAVNLSVNLNVYEINAGNMIICTAGDIVKVERIGEESADGFHIVMIAMSHQFASELRLDFKRILNEGLTISETPVIKVNEKAKDIFGDCLKLIAKVTTSGLEMYKDAVRSLVSSMVSLAAGQWLVEAGKARAKAADMTNARGGHKKFVFEQFIKLVSEYYSEHRMVSFYADRLCMSPKYLSKLVKEVSGKSAPEWIDAYVMLEAKNLLKYSDMAIKEVVYRLNFPNQTAFYKYFKSHTGMTPTEYRNS